MKELRLLPLLILACGALLGLKLLSFIQPENGTLRLFAGLKPLFAQEAEVADDTEQVEGAEEAQADEAAQAGAEKQESEKPQPATRTELGILQSLRARRETLSEQEKELELRENLLKAAEQRLEERIAELEKLETRLTAVVDAEKSAREAELKGLVTMYETMKPKEAARIFDRLPMDVLLEVVNAMSPRKMSAILARMSPDSAQQLTSQLAKPKNKTPNTGFEHLPKIGD